MNERMVVVQQKSEKIGEEMNDELCTILETTSVALRAEALRIFCEKYSHVEIDETGDGVMDWAKMLLKIDEASVNTKSLVE